MLLLVTIGLVVIGTISLVIGFIRNSLGPIYVSILCSVVAGIVLVVFSRMSRRQATVPATAAAGEPALDVQPEEPVLSVVGAADPEAAEEEVAGPPEAAAPPVGELDLDELDMVREHEERGKNRATLLKRIDDRIDELEAAEPVPAAPTPPPVPAAVAAAPSPSSATLPIADYDELGVAEILPLLDELDDDELETVAEYEERTKNRQTIIQAIDAIFEEPAPAPASAQDANPPAKKTVAKKAPAKKMPAKKAVAKKAAAPAKKTASKKAAAPAKKAPARKAGAPAKKAAKSTKKT